MNVSGIKKIVEEMKLSPEAVAKINEMLGSYTESEDVSNEIIDKIIAIVDIEADTIKLAADIYQTGIDMADDYLNKMDEAAGKMADEIDDKVNTGVL